MELKKKYLQKNFFLKNFWFLKIPKKKFGNFSNFFSKKLESVNHWLECIKLWESYSSSSSRYGRCENCTKNVVFCPKITLGWWKVNVTPKRHFCISIPTFCVNIKVWLKLLYELQCPQENVPKTHCFAPNSEPPYLTSTTPPKGTSTALHLPWVKIWRPNSKRFLSYARNKICPKNNKKNNKKKSGLHGAFGSWRWWNLFLWKTWASASLAYSAFAFLTSN